MRSVWGSRGRDSRPPEQRVAARLQRLGPMQGFGRRVLPGRRRGAVDEFGEDRGAGRAGGGGTSFCSSVSVSTGSVAA